MKEVVLVVPDIVSEIVNEIINLDESDLNIKMSTGKDMLEPFNVCKSKSDGRCGAHCISKLIYNTDSKEKKVMTKLNKDIINRWNFNKDVFFLHFLIVTQ